MGHFDPLFLSSSPGSGSGKGQRKDLTSKKSLEFSLIRTESSDEAYDSAVSEKQVNSIALNSRSGSSFHSKSSPHSMQNSFADILLPKWNCTSRIGLKRHDPRLILDMYPLFQVHHKENENQDLLYPAPKLLCHPLLQNHHPPPQVKLVLVVAPGAVAPGVGKSLENGVALICDFPYSQGERVTYLERALYEETGRVWGTRTVVPIELELAKDKDRRPNSGRLTG
nr:hypothetical protein DEO72_LG2g3861 [Ipomoea batatas]